MTVDRSRELADDAEPPLVPDRVDVAVPFGGRVVIVSDIHLGNVSTGAATHTTDALAEALREIDGRGVLVIAGDGFEMLACPPDIRAILDAHPDFVAAVSGFAAGDGHRVIVLPGNHDGQLAWDADAVGVVLERLGADTMAMSCDLVIETGAATQRVRVVHGNQDDPFNRFVDVRAPLDTPLGHHVVREILPRIDPGDAPGALLEDIRWLNDTDQIPQFIGSRLLYRKIIGRLWLIAIPFAAAVALRLVAFLPGIDDVMRLGATRWLLGLGIAMVFIALVAAAASLGTMLRVRRALAEAGAGEGGGPVGHNASARERAAHLIADGYAGLVTGHTHIPELAVVGQGFYANSGCGIRSVIAQPTRFGLPATFVPVRRSSRVELTAGATLEARLVTGDEPMRSPVLLERLVTRPDRADPTEPTVVAALPGGGTWPITDVRFGQWVGRRRVRRIAAGLLVAAGVLDIASAFIRHLRDLGVVDRVLPFTVHPVAGVGAVLTGCALIGVARGARLGRRRAWLAAIALLLIAAVAHLLKGNHVEEAVIGAVLAGWLALQHRHFRVNPPGRGRALATVVMLGLFAVALMAGLGVAIGGETSETRPAIALAVGVVVLLAALVGRFRGPRPATPEDRELAADIVARHGVSTFDELALIGTNRWLFSGDTVIAHTVHDDVMTVSPDPVGPPAEHADAWADAMDHADTFGWSIAVLGASHPWLAIYRAAGLTDTFIGDDVIIPVGAIDAAAVAPLRERLAELRTLGYRIDTSTEDDRLDTVARDPSGQVVLADGHVWSARVDGWLLVGREHGGPVVDGLADAVVLTTLCWMGEHRGSSLAIGPVPGGGAGADTGIWAGAPGAAAQPRYAIGDSAHTGPGSRDRSSGAW